MCKNQKVFCKNEKVAFTSEKNNGIMSCIVRTREVRDVIKKEMIAMLLAGGQGSRLGVLTANVAKPAVSFGGKYRIIDFPLSNCINSGVDTVPTVKTEYPYRNWYSLGFR